MTELSFNQQKKLVDIATDTANKLADWSFIEEVEVDNEFMKHFEFMVKEILIGVLYYKYGRKAEIMSRSEEIKTTKAEAVREFAEILKNKSQLVAPSVYAEPFRAVSVEEIDRLAKRK